MSKRKKITDYTILKAISVPINGTVTTIKNAPEYPIVDFATQVGGGGATVYVPGITEDWPQMRLTAAQLAKVPNSSDF